ncbi:hypothetical protein GQ43DRAFT_366837 [Delitschia confertaspora ATCC 74209]|uniref:Uncharacterized protein n=1 Tax=Delitschia confertaspora ATCC 74209 TaxID=1513339 RepID=A0A9P4MXQ8_9PLEO|nr:hypothetical protein GQ43DRAFT_366837 [Delitschia confertaspora ATCC 74209]
MSKRHNRKRTRSRPRHRDVGKTHPPHPRINSFNITPHYSFPSPYFPLPVQSAGHWHQTYSSIWQDRLHQEYEKQWEAHRLRFFGGEAGEEASLLEPMLKVVTDLFDGNLDYEDD